MKTLRILFTLLFIAAFSTLGFGQIATSAHDFSGAGWGTTEICEACHTPHNGLTSIADAPLWNHTVPLATTFTEYISSTMNATTGDPGGISLLCLSCHDGVTNLDAFGGSAGSTNMGAAYVGTTAVVGQDLTNDHPISFDYTSAVAAADGQLHDPDLTPAVAALLFDGSMECASCHDVHNSTGELYLLRLSNAGSALCLTCHNK